MKATQRLHDAVQSRWLDNITRALLSSGKLQRYIDELSTPIPPAPAQGMRTPPGNFSGRPDLS